MSDRLVTRRLRCQLDDAIAAQMCTLPRLASETATLGPTVELHRHFEAGLRPETVARMAATHGVTEVRDRAGNRVDGLDPQDPDDVRRYYAGIAAGFKRPDGFQRFVDSFGLPLSVLRTLEDLEQAAFEQIVDLAARGSLHTEIRGSIGTYQATVGAPLAEILGALRAGVRRAFETHRASGTYVVAFSRQNGLGPADGPWRRRQAPDVCRAILEAYDPDDPIGLDIAGFPEIDYPPRDFVDVTAPLREAGVPITIHCGEQGRAPDYAGAPPALIREAVEVLGVQRIGHGNSLAADPGLRAELAARGIGVECCPHSALCMGFIDRLEDHPLPVMLQEGLRATINTDDPLMFGDHTVRGLLDRCAGPLSLGAAEARALAENGIATAFVSPDRRRWLEAEFARRVDAR